MRQTPVSIPIGWSQRKLGILGDTFGGLTGKSKEDFGRGKPYVPYLNVYSNAQVNTDALEYVGVAEDENQNTLRYGDIIFTTSSETPDEVGISSVLLDEPRGQLYLNSFCFAFRLHNFDDLLPEYAKYLFRAQPFRKRMFRLAQGASRYNLSKSHFVDEVVLLPPPEEQKRIVQILETWDDAIRSLSAAIGLKESRLEGMKSRILSGNLRLPGFSTPWRHFEIGNFATVVSRTNTKAIEYPVLSCTKYDGLVKSLEYFGRKIYGDDLSKYKVVNRGEFAYATNHVEEGSLGYQDVCDTALISPMYTVFKTNTEKVDDRFIYCLLKTPRMVYHYQSNMSGSIARRGGLRWDTFATLPVFMPPKNEQVAIADVIKTAEREIEFEQRKLALLKDQHSQLLSDLVNGNTRTLQVMSTSKNV